MRIIFLTITFDPEPGAQHGLPLARWLQARGHDVTVLTSFPQYPMGKIYPGYRTRPWHWETMDGVRVLRVPIYPSHDRSIARRMATYLSFMGAALVPGVPLVGPADVTFLYEPPPTNGVAALALKRFRGTPIVHHIADMWPETVIEAGVLNNVAATKAVEYGIGAFCRLLYRQASYISVLSPGFKRMLVERGVPSEKVSVIYNWADEKNFSIVPRDKELAATLGMSDAFNVVYAGNIGPLQGVDTLIRAAALLKDRPQIQFAVIGTGPNAAQVQTLARNLNLTNVRFIERQAYTTMARINALADVLLVHLQDKKFLSATIPSKTQVAMACGRPLVLAVRGDAAELVRRARAGITCQPEDAAGIAKAILGAYEMPRADLEAMGANGRRYYLERLSLDASAGRLEELFARAAFGANAARGRREDAAPVEQAEC